MHPLQLFCSMLVHVRVMMSGQSINLIDLELSTGSVQCHHLVLTATEELRSDSASRWAAPALHAVWALGPETVGAREVSFTLNFHYQRDVFIVTLRFVSQKQFDRFYANKL